MSEIKETIKIKIGDKTIDVYHDGIKPYEDWVTDSKQGLQEWVQETIDKGETEGWMPFANFEASVSFKLKD